MLNVHVLQSCAVAGCASATAIFLLYFMAGSLGLIDRPNERKHHIGNVPLIGGLATYLGVLAGAAYHSHFHVFSQMLLGTAGVLVVLGAVDDRRGLGVRVRMAVQVLVILVMIGVTDVHIRSLGVMFGHNVDLGMFGVPVTVVAIVGLVNAFNMMDGIDGLVGCLTLASVASIILYDGQADAQTSKVVLLLLAGASLPYLIANFGIGRHKVFLGDAGSTVIGYVLAWVLIRLSQDRGTPLTQVDTLWCVALPVFDTIAVSVRRVIDGTSPFKPDRGHIHHLMLRAGLGARATLAVLILMAVVLAIVGVLVRYLDPGINVLMFVALLAIYVTATCMAWRALSARDFSGMGQSSQTQVARPS
ncbi:UDP-GlcNAc:undecaprenyl-phosphate GlcNAc-1-phosphate transferase [Dyella sp. OK004]|uniref:hypothetical protein n=1 Tax=Dyella sp. OK004 TaxID=1855292 RepID=UPI0008E3A0B0|nr:hypothetical protein [Dyella sp. OK004]SFR99855.1 UDP-GlcNAc:undecaprenyl-phosphate GlcNAc-1-phosphate transferase [Dyella sp. OK004]